MGRYKLGPQGVYFDPNDSGPDQAAPMQSQGPAPGIDPSLASPGPLYGGYRNPTKPIGIQTNGGLPGDPNLPGYGDWNTSNPWRDSLSYDQIMHGAGMRLPGGMGGGIDPMAADARMTGMMGGNSGQVQPFLSYLGYGFGSQPQGGGLFAPFVSKLGTKAPNANSGGMGSAVMGALGSPLKKLGIF